MIKDQQKARADIPGLSPAFFAAMGSAAQPITICSAASIVIQGDAETPAPDSFSWEVLQTGAWVSAPGVNNTEDFQPLSLVNNTATSILFSIRRKYTTGGVVNYDSFYDVTVLPSAPVTNNTLNTPTVSSFCSPGNAAVITGSTPTGGDGNITYQWQSSTDNTNFNDIAGATSGTYDPPQINTTTYYRRKASAGSCVTPSVSNAITITIVQPVTNNVITGPAVSTFCSTGDASAISGNTPLDGDGTYTYQWQVSADNATFTDIAGATSMDYDPATITATTYYRRMAKSGVCTTPVLSNTVTFTILPVLSNNVITAPVIATFCSSGDAANIAGNTPSGGNGTYSYQWQRSTDNLNFIDISGVTSRDYDPPAVTVTTYYRRTITSGPCTTPLASNVITVIVLPYPVAPATTQATVTVCPGSQAVLSVNSPQAGFTYNWYDSATKTTLLATGTTYTTAPQTVSKSFYVESSNGTCVSQSLTTVQVNVSTPPNAPVLVNSTVDVCAGTAAVLSVASPQTGFTYTWYQSASGGSSIATGVNYTTPVLSINSTYYVEATNAGGCISATRTPVSVNLNALPQLTVQGASVCSGSSAVLTATANMSNVTINWYADAAGGSPIGNGNAYNTPPLSSNTNYYVEATNNITGCVSATRVRVQAGLLQPLPAPVVRVGTSAETSVTFTWDAVNGAVGYKVSTDNGSTFTDPSSGVNGLSHTVTGLHQDQAVSIVVQTVGASGCQLSANSVAVTTKAESQTDDIFVANAFTPNGDGKNDVVYVHSEGIKSVNFYVYNQWGELLFNSADIANGWDGTYKGVKEPAGVYIYYLKAVMNNGHLLNKKGTITLLR